MKFLVKGEARVDIYFEVEADDEDEAWEFAEGVNPQDLEEEDFQFPAFDFMVTDVEESKEQ
mgnify:CR=1 FL=1